MSACKRWNNLRVERDELVTDRETHLNANNWKIINLRADAKNRAKRHYVQWSCQHCIEPACVGVCPVTAITKLPNGAVVINEKKCIGCRYCFQACPWKVPQFDFEKRVTRKCHLAITEPCSIIKNRPVWPPARWVRWPSIINTKSSWKPTAESNDSKDPVTSWAWRRPAEPI